MENLDQGTSFHEQTNQQVWQIPIPNSNAVLVMGIMSILTSFWFGVIGLTLGIISLVMASKANKIYLANPSMYTQTSYANMKAGKICAIIGTCLATMILLFIMMFIAFFVTMFANMPSIM